MSFILFISPQCKHCFPFNQFFITVIRYKLSQYNESALCKKRILVKLYAGENKTLNVCWWIHFFMLVHILQQVISPTSLRCSSCIGEAGEAVFWWRQEFKWRHHLSTLEPSIVAVESVCQSSVLMNYYPWSHS